MKQLLIKLYKFNTKSYDRDKSKDVSQNITNYIISREPRIKPIIKVNNYKLIIIIDLKF